jgi:hypothetical protein
LYTNVEGKKSGSIQLLLATQSRGSGRGLRLFKYEA